MATLRLDPQHPIVAPLLGACVLLSACAGDDPSSTASDTSASETTTESESDGACEPAAAGVTIPDAPYFAAGDEDPSSQLDAVSCEVTAAGFACVVDGGELVVDVDSVFAGLAMPPWQVGDSVSLTTSLVGPSRGSMAVRAADATLLALALWTVDMTASEEPLALTFEDAGCDGDVPPLLVRYAVGDESVTILGSDTATLGDLQIFQEEAADHSSYTAGEIREAVTVAVIRAG
jgi:hypothetical protein